MQVNSGYLVCPNCHSIGMSCFRKWESKTQYVDQEPMITYILYESYSACIFYSLFRNPKKEKIDQSSAVDDILDGKGCCGAICYLILFILSSVFYLLIFVWFDIANVCCTKKKRIYKRVRGFIKERNKIATVKKIFTINIWNEVEGMPEYTINQSGIVKCPECKFKPSTFSDFIQNKPQIQTVITMIDNSTSQINQNAQNNNTIPINPEKIKPATYDINKQFKIKPETISVIFTYLTGQIQKLCIYCLKNDPFKECKNKLFQKHPELKNKRLYYICNGSVIDENKTMNENRIKSDDQILVQDYDLDAEQIE